MALQKYPSNQQMFSFSQGWYLLYTMPKQEKSVAKYLQEQSIVTFLPEIQKVGIHTVRKKKSTTVMFPSYAFVYLSTLTDFFRGGDVKGVVNYVRVGKIPVRVDEKIVSQIKLVAASTSQVEISDEQFQSGSQFIIENGPFEGLICEVVSHQGNKKALIRVLVLGRCILIDLRNTSLTRVDLDQNSIK